MDNDDQAGPLGLSGTGRTITLNNNSVLEYTGSATDNAGFGKLRKQLGGDGTGTLRITNPAARIDAGVINAGLIKDGPGTLYIGGNSTAAMTAGNLTVAGGAVVLNGGFSSAGSVTVKNGAQILMGAANRFTNTNGTSVALEGTFDLNGHNTTVGAFNGTGGLVTNTGTAAKTGVSGNTVSANNDATLTIGKSNTSGNFGGNIQDDARKVLITKIGTGTQIFSGNNTYTGATAVNAGTLLNQGTISNSAITVASGATFGTASASTTGAVTVNSGGVFLSGGGTVNNLNLNNGGTLRLALNNLGTATVLTDVTALSTTGTVSLDVTDILSLLQTVGTKHVLNVTNHASGSVADFVVTGVSLPRGIPTVEVQGNQLVLNVTSGLGNLVWASPASGGNQDLWKAGDSTLTHWTGNYNHFENQDYVTFDDTAAWKKVLISGDVLPGGIIVDTDVGYEMGGSGDIKGSASLVKRGTGILTIGNDANAYTGGTLIADGGIVATHVNALGGASAVVTMRSNTTLSVPTGFASKIVLADNATVTVTLPAVDATLDSTIEGTGNVTVMGTGRRTFTGTAGFTGTLTVTDAFTFSGANANWANTDVVSTTATADCIFSGSGTMQFSTVTVGGAGRLLVNSGTNLDVAKISALDTLTFEGGGKLSSGTGALRFEVASGSTVTWNNNTFVNSASTKLVKEGEGTLTVTNFDSTDQSRNIEVLGGTLRVTTASTKSIARNYLIQGSSATDIATFTVALAADSSIGFFSQLQGDEAGGRDATMTMQYGKLYFESGVCHGLPNAITMRSSTIEFATGRSNNGLYQIASLPMTFVVERPSDMTTGVAVSYLKATHSSANVEGIHLTNRNGTTQFDIRENAKLVVEAILTGETGSPGSGGNLIKNGAGEMELTAANKYAGTTTINGGTLSISGNNNGTTQAYSVAAGATLRLAGEGTINAASAVTLGGGASLVFDRTTALTFANTLTGSGATLHKLGADEVHVSGTVSGFTGALIVEDGSLRFTNVPTVTRLELSSGATVNVGTNTLGLTGPGQVSFAGHSQSGGFSGSDIEGSLAISGGHHLRIGADGSADALRVSQNLALNNVTLHFEIQDGGSHDTLAIGGDLSVTSAKLLFETNGGIVLPGTYDIIRVGGAALTDADLAKFTCEGIITSESIRSNIVLADGGKTVRLLVEKTGVSYIWRGNPASDDWDTASSNWLKRDQGTDIGLTAFPLNGDAIFDGGGARDVRITGVLKPLEITLNAGAGHYTLANIGAGKLSGVSGIVVNDGASLTLASDGTANDFTGRMIILTGATVTLTGAAPLLADAGVASVAGAGALAESIYINGGSLVLDGSMGNATTTNRAFMMGQAGATLEVTGANAGTRATFNGTGSVVQYGAGARTLTLTGGGEGVLGLTLADGDGAAQLSVVKEGAGTWFLSGSNTFTGGVALREGVLAVGGGSALGATGTLLFDGGTLSNLSASGAGVTLTLANPVSVSATGGVIRAISGEKLAFDGTISGDGALVKREAGDLVIRGGNTFKGGLGVEAGHVEARNRSASGTGILTLAGGTFYDMYVGSVEVGALAGSGDVGNLSSTLVVLTILGTNAAEQTFSGTLTDGSATAALTHLTKTGSGAQVLSGANTYSGITNVTGGILRMGHASALGNSRTVNVFGSGTLDVGGHDLALAGRALTVEGGGASGGGALIDSVGGGRVVPFTLNSDITVRTMGTTTLEGVDSAASWALTLGALAGATDATFLIDDVGTGIGQMTVENATALKLVADESLSSSLSLTLNTGGRLLLASATQTFDVLGGSGSVDGTGTLRLQSGADAVFDGTLDGAVNLVVVQNAAVRLGNAASTTTGEIRIRGALALDVALGTGGASDVLGAHSSTVVIENGSLRVAAAGVSQTNRVLTLAGTSGAILSDGGALRLLNGNGIAFAAGVADYTLALGGSGGGESQLDALLSDTPGGALALVKSGGGTWALSRANTYTGGTFVENGTLALLADDAVAQGGTVRLGKGSASGVLELRGHAVTLGALTVDGVGASNRIVNNAAMAGSLSLSIGAGNVFTGALGVSGGAAALNNFSLTKTGAGTLTLSGVTAYTGDTLVAQGTLALGGAAQLAGAKTTVAPGAALDATGLSGGLLINAGQTLVAGSNGATADLRGVFNLAGGTLEVGSATASNILRIDGSLNVTAASTLDYILTSRPSNGSSILRVGALDLGAVTRISPELASGVLYIGSYTLFEYGTLSGDLSNLQIDTAHIDPRYQFEVRNDAANRRVTLAVSSISSGVALLWRGNLGTNWDGTHENFEKPPSSPASYFPGEAARFDNTAHSFDVDVGDGVFIGSLFFDNDATHTYTLRSAGGVDNRISGDGYLEKRGAGTLIIAMENDYDGALREDGSRAAATVLVEGTIVTAHDRALGLGGVLLYGGALKADADRALANAITIAEGATAGVDSNGHVFTLSGALASKATSTLLKTGAGVLALEGDGSAFLGELKVGQGVVRMGGVDLSGGVVNLSAASTGLEVLMAGGPARVGELRGVSGSVVSGSGLLEAGALGGEATFLGAIQGTLELRKTGAGVLVLAGDNSAHSGALVSALGRLQIGDGLSGTMNSGALSVLHDATLAVNLPTDWTLAQTVSGDGLFEKAGARTLTLNQANPGLSGGVLISGGLLELAGAGTLGTASVEAAGTLLFSKTGDYAFANDVTGTGVLIKAGDSGTATYLGAGRGVDVRSVELHSGVLAIGDGAQVLQQKFLAGTTLSDGTLLHLAPATGGGVTVGSLLAAGSGRVEKTGGGVATLIGQVRVGGGVDVVEGRLSVGDGSGREMLAVSGGVNVRHGAVFQVSRTGETRIEGALTGAGLLRFWGDANGAGTTVLLNAANAFTGDVELSRHAVLQIGDTGLPSQISGGAPVSINVEGNSVLRFTAVASGETGAALTIVGNGNVEYRGGGVLRHTSDSTAFQGTFRAAAGTFVFDAAQLGSHAAFDATGNGVLRIESVSAATTMLPANFGTGNGTVELGAADGTASARYGFGGTVRFGGTLSVGDRAMLSLSGNTIEAAILGVTQGGTLSGTGYVAGNLFNAVGGTLRPGGDLGSPGAFNVAGDFFNEGRVVVSLAAASATTVHYTGMAFLGTTGSLQVHMSAADYLRLRSGAVFPAVLVDDVPGADGAGILGGFAPQNITFVVREENGTDRTITGAEHNAFTYNSGTGLALFDGSIADIFGRRDGLDEFGRYLDATLRGGDAALRNVVVGLLGGGAGAVGAASPAGLASMTAMPIGIAHEDSANVFAHLQSLRYERGATNGRPVELQPYLTSAGSFARNGSATDSPAFNFNTYGGTVGFDQSLGTDVIAGFGAGYRHGRADLADAGGSVAQDNVRLNLYATWQVNDHVYVDAAMFAGYSSYGVRHQTVFGTGRASSNGIDIGGSLFGGGILSLSREFHLTPFAGIEYAHAKVDAFIETGSAAALRVGGFDQDSLRAKLGTGLNWQVPTGADFSLRLSLELAYAYELMDSKVAIRGRFAGDSSGNGFSAKVASLPEHSLQVGPAAEIGFDENTSLRLSYLLEHDLKEQVAHRVNATLRVRF
ncbi:MAG: autotransporter-associated beta strand repeat-containing protein [Puniceicoccales bacterium]|nr:autotransporter-associated beta strand repeat-containing protein [Puniceicoccales bacterium]